jgi:TatD DNase family protein
MPAFDVDRAEMLARAASTGVRAVLAITGIRMTELGVTTPKIFATTGVHPHEAQSAQLDEVEKLAKDPRVLAIGEIGLDYHYDHSPRPVQADVFVKQMEIARAAGKPIVIHTREAWPDTLRLLHEHWAGSGLGGVMHCFSGDLATAHECIDMGFLISIAGPLTFPKSQELRDVAAQLPADRLLIETDSPYLAPVPHRGKRNEPAFVAEVCKRLAEIRGVAVEEMDACTTANFSRLFRVEI